MLFMNITVSLIKTTSNVTKMANENQTVALFMKLFGTLAV